VSARSRRQTLVRVAEARALVARRAVADDLARIATAVTEADARRDRLAEAGLAGGTPLALAGTTQVRLLRASALREAEESVRLAVQASDASLQAWTEARRSQRLAEELRERERQERAEARQREEQREADELASQRRRDDES
jgi:hypothetical protein